MAIVDAARTHWHAEPQGSEVKLGGEMEMKWPNDLTTREEAIARANTLKRERDAAYSSLEKLLPHKPYHENCTCRNCSDYREAKELLARRNK